jgi:phosphoribosylamine-glycine ligase
MPSPSSPFDGCLFFLSIWSATQQEVVVFGVRDGDKESDRQAAAILRQRWVFDFRPNNQVPTR